MCTCTAGGLEYYMFDFATIRTVFVEHGSSGSQHAGNCPRGRQPDNCLAILCPKCDEAQCGVGQKCCNNGCCTVCTDVRGRPPFPPWPPGQTGQCPLTSGFRPDFCNADFCGGCQEGKCRPGQKCCVAEGACCEQCTDVRGMPPFLSNFKA